MGENFALILNEDEFLIQMKWENGKIPPSFGENVNKPIGPMPNEARNNQ